VSCSRDVRTQSLVVKSNIYDTWLCRLDVMFFRCMRFLLEIMRYVLMTRNYICWKLCVVFSWHPITFVGNSALCSCKTRLHLLEIMCCVLVTHDYICWKLCAVFSWHMITSVGNYVMCSSDWRACCHRKGYITNFTDTVRSLTCSLTCINMHQKK
jgi:hypothetical protein